MLYNWVYTYFLKDLLTSILSFCDTIIMMDLSFIFYNKCEKIEFIFKPNMTLGFLVVHANICVQFAVKYQTYTIYLLCINYQLISINHLDNNFY